MKSKDLFERSDWLKAYIGDDQNIRRLYRECQKEFVNYIKDAKNKIRLCGNGYIAKRQREFLEAEIFHFSPRHDIIVIFRSIFQDETIKGFGKLPSHPFWVVHTFSDDGGRVYLHGLADGTFNAYGGHFFDRYSERSYGNDLSRIRSLACFTASTAFGRTVMRQQGSDRIYMEGDGGVAVGELVFGPENRFGYFYNTFLTEEMHESDLRKFPAVWTAMDEFAIPESEISPRYLTKPPLNWSRA